MFRLENKIAAVTGGGSGIGKAVSKVLAAQGATVHIIDLSADNAQQTLDEIKKDKGQGQTHVCDVSRQDQVTNVFNSIGKLDILVNSAGIAHIGTVVTTSEQDFQRLFDVNVKGVYNCLHAAIPNMKKGSAIVNVSSIVAHIGLEDRFAYSMTKGAVHSMTMSVARDFMKAGIRCNSVSPARVHTSFVDGFINKNYPGKEKEMFQKLSEAQPIGRMGAVEEVAALVLYLSSDEASFITGNDYPIDGGVITMQ
jgi:NAD(P)-dependent dehydrogenase (short-subunit alcohol dehydrogenase family)